MIEYLCVQIRLKKEQEQKEHKKKEKAEAHLYTIIKVLVSSSLVLSPLFNWFVIYINILMILFVNGTQVARGIDLSEQIGSHIYFDLVDHDKVQSFRIQKQTIFNDFKVKFKCRIINFILS